MTTIRIQKTQNFSIISNHHLRNTNLSLKAMGLLTLLLSLPDDWNANVKHLITICRDGKAAIYSAIKELRDAGYIDHVAIRNDKAKIIKWEYIVHENPIEKPVNGNDELLPDFQHVGFQDVGNRDGIIKTKSPLLKTEVNKNDDVPVPPPPPPSDPVPKVKEPSSFSSHNLNNLMQALPQKRRSPQVEKRLEKALKAEHSIDYLLDCIAYSNDKNPKNFLSYLGNCIDKDYAPEGYHQQSRKNADEVRELVRQRSIEQKQEAIEQERLKQQQTTLNELIESDPDCWERLEKQAADNLGMKNPKRPGPGGKMKIRYEVLRIMDAS